VNRMTSSEPQGIQKSVLALMLIYAIFVFGRHWVRFIYEHESPTPRALAQAGKATSPLARSHGRGKGDECESHPPRPFCT